MPLSEPDAATAVVGAHLPASCLQHLPASCLQQSTAVAQDDDAMAVEEVALFTFLLAAVCLAGILLRTWIKQKEAMRYGTSPSSLAYHLSGSSSSPAFSSGQGSFSSLESAPQCKLSRSASSSVVAAQLEQLRVQLTRALPHSAAPRGSFRERRRASTEDPGSEVFEKHSLKANTSARFSSSHGSDQSESMGCGGSRQSQANTVVSSLVGGSVSTVSRRVSTALERSGSTPVQSSCASRAFTSTRWAQSAPDFGVGL